MFFAKPKPDEALLRVGIGGSRSNHFPEPKVAIGRRLFINPLVHNVARVSLSTYDIEVTCKGANSVRTADGFRVDINAVFYVRVHAFAEAVLKSARSFGTTAQHEAIRATLKPKLKFTLKSIAGEWQMSDLLHKRLEFADTVNESIGGELLEQNGLFLEHVGFSSVEQTPLSAYSPDDVFDAEAIPRLCAMMAERMRKKAETIESTNKKVEEILQKREVNADVN